MYKVKLNKYTKTLGVHHDVQKIVFINDVTQNSSKIQKNKINYKKTIFLFS